ncbi:DUF3267 domain-containing protein [Oceanobacillus senegalensis]|uniref:DUF3267 domain-containing protein n=1 Tax=Oceanobacillus senegalensis TaxID=1936063 RepID=UPI000A3106C7|nr:DUF3267 domain-containing protein [Oceanobacillus senegalensis]
MNCWKTIKLRKEIGLNRIILTSFFLSILTFIIFYVPFSIYHGPNRSHEAGFIPFVISLCFLPTIHSFIHILPLIMMKKRVKINYKLKMKYVPIFTYYTKSHMNKNILIIVLLSPTVFITMPGMITTYLYAEYYLYSLLFTCIHVGVSYIDFWYLVQIKRAPKKAFIQNANDGLDILLKAN